MRSKGKNSLPLSPKTVHLPRKIGKRPPLDNKFFSVFYEHVTIRNHHKGSLSGGNTNQWVALFWSMWENCLIIGQQFINCPGMIGQARFHRWREIACAV